MLRLRWMVLAAVLVAALAGTWAFAGGSSQGSAADNGIGLQDPVHLAAAHQMVAALPLPAQAAWDVYSTACQAAADECLTSQSWTPTALFATMTSSMRTAGARVLSHTCAKVPGPLGRACSENLDFHGAHLAAAVGTEGLHRTTWLSITVADKAAAQAYLMTPLGKPLRAWAAVDPFPAGWHVVAGCSRPTAGGCSAYRNDASQTLVATSLDRAVAVAEASVTKAGYRIDTADCFPAGATVGRHCTLSAARFRTLGGHDGVTLAASLTAVDAGHVAVLAGLSTS